MKDILNRKGKDHGFTLLEVVICLGIIALVLVAVFHLQAQNLDLQSEAQFMTIATCLLQERLSQIQARETIEEGKEVVLRKKDLPSGVSFADVVLDTLGKVQEGKAEIRFFANGCVEHTLIHLKNEGGKFYTLEINPVTGLIRTHEGYIEQKREGSRFHAS